MRANRAWTAFRSFPCRRPLPLPPCRLLGSRPAELLTYTLVKPFLVAALSCKNVIYTQSPLYCKKPLPRLFSDGRGFLRAAGYRFIVQSRYMRSCARSCDAASERRRAAESINILLSGRFEPFRALLPRINNRANGKILQAGEDFRRKIVKNLRTVPRGLDICAPP